MLFSAQLPLSSLIELCRAMRHYLDAGLTLRDVFRHQAGKGSLPVRPVAERIRRDIERGDSLEDALKREKAAFPPLFLALAAVGEQSGTLPDVFRELERYFVMQQKLRRQFLAQSAFPAFQFIVAVFVIAIMLWAFGFIGEMNNSKPIDPLGLGWTGTSGALTFLGVAFGSVAALGGLYLLATRTLQQKTTVDEFLLRVPVIGPCLRALALARFCLALGLTSETGMSILPAMRLSLRATGNAAFSARTEITQDALRSGEELTVALARTRLFPEEFQNILAVAEESGMITEVMRRQAQHYEEEAGRRLTVLTQVAGWGVWLLVAILIIVAIFRIFTTVYLGALESV